MKGVPTAKATIRPFPAPGVSYRRRRQELMKGILAEEFMVFFRSHPELTEEQALSAFVDAVKDRHPALHEEMVSHGSKESAPRREVELYIGFPIPEHVRQAFEKWLDAHPSISEEDGAAFLLAKGLEVEPDDHPSEEVQESAPPRALPVRRSRTRCHSRMARLRLLLARS